jgi:NADH-quinone oxidoreductase subunit K
MAASFLSPLAALFNPLAAGVDMPLEWVVGLGLALFSVGLLGVACRRNILIMLLSVEIMLNAANVVLVAFSRVHSELSGQVFVFFSMTVAAAEVAIGLAIVIAVYRLRKSTDVDDATDLHEVDYGPVPPLKLEGEDQLHHDDHGDTDHASDAGSDDAALDSAEPLGAAGEA